MEGNETYTNLKMSDIRHRETSNNLNEDQTQKHIPLRQLRLKQNASSAMLNLLVVLGSLNN